MDELLNNLNWELLERNDIIKKNDFVVLSINLYDPSNTLNKMRIILKNIIENLHNQHFGNEPGHNINNHFEHSFEGENPPLYHLALDLKDKKIISKIMFDFILFAFRMGNKGSHNSSIPEEYVKTTFLCFLIALRDLLENNFRKDLDDGIYINKINWEGVFKHVFCRNLIETNVSKNKRIKAMKEEIKGTKKRLKDFDGDFMKMEKLIAEKKIRESIIKEKDKEILEFEKIREMYKEFAGDIYKKLKKCSELAQEFKDFPIKSRKKKKLDNMEKEIMELLGNNEKGMTTNQVAKILNSNGKNYTNSHIKLKLIHLKNNNKITCFSRGKNEKWILLINAK